MVNNKQQAVVQSSEALRVGLLLAMAGGFLDAYTYLGRGHVFANAQTGIIVMLGVDAARGDWAGAGHYLLPILAFVAGVLLAVTLALDAFALAVWGTEKGKSGADA